MYEFGTGDTRTLFIYDDGQQQSVDFVDLTLSDEAAYVNVSSGDDVVLGSQLGDHIVEWTGDDYIDGQGGSDIIEAGFGSDTITGGEGNDLLYFGKKYDDGDFDIVTDFDFSEDGLAIRDFNGVSVQYIFSLEDLYALAGAELTVERTSSGTLLTFTPTPDATHQVLLQGVDALPLEGQAPEKMMIMMTFGQSLAGGATNYHQYEVLTPEPIYAENAFGMSFADETDLSSQFLGFTPLIETTTETLGSSMVNRVIYEHAQAGQDLPNIVHFNAASGGKSILELMTRAEDIFSTLEDGLLGTAVGGHFAIQRSDGLFEHYINDSGVAYATGTTTAETGSHFADLETYFSLAVATAEAEGYALDTRVPFVWVQGQSDNALSAMSYDYEYHLRLLLDQVRDMAETYLGAEAEITMIDSLSQHRGYGSKGVAIQSIGAVTAEPDAVFGVPEYQFEASEPSVVGQDYTHLNPEGYYMMGQTLGAKIFDALEGTPDDPILISGYEVVSSTQILVQLTGADGGLVDDPSIYRAENGMIAPDHFGFELYNSNSYKPASDSGIIGATIIGADEILLDFSNPLSGDYLLYLGRSGDVLIDPDVNASQGLGFGGTTLRSAQTEVAMDPVSGRFLDDPLIYEYAPIQVIELYDL